MIRFACTPITPAFRPRVIQIEIDSKEDWDALNDFVQLDVSIPNACATYGDMNASWVTDFLRGLQKLMKAQSKLDR